VGSKDDDAWPGKQNKTPKCLFSTTQARGRKQGGLNSYHQHWEMLNAEHQALNMDDPRSSIRIRTPKDFSGCTKLFRQTLDWLGLS
jgi:hypothetical protein